MEHVLQNLRHFYGQYVSIKGLKALGNYSASIWIEKIPILLWESPTNSHFYNFGIFEPVTKPPNQPFLSLETPGHLQQNQENNPGTFLNSVIFVNLKLWEIYYKFCQFGKRRAPRNDETPLNNISKIMDMGSISINKQEMEIW